MPEVETWWRHVRESAADLDGHPPYELVSRVCAADEEVAAGTIVRGALRESARGWSGPFVEASTRKIMTFYPGAPGTCGTAFSRQKCHETRAAIKPSLEFYTWLVACGSEWQLRGDLELSDDELDVALGAALRRRVRVTSASLWGGAGGTRTPLHSDAVHALIFQLSGEKKFFLCSRAAVRAAVDKAKLPRAVLDEGGTECFCVDGALEAVHGLDQPEPRGARGELAVLRAGDCLVLPAGLYHDVASCDAPALSLTLRFELLQDTNDDEAAAAPLETTTKEPIDGQSVQKFFMRLALKKAMQQNRQQPPQPPQDDAPAAAG